MKRLLSAVLCSMMLFSTTVYAQPAEDAKAVYEEMLVKTQTMPGINAYYDMNLDMYHGPENAKMRVEMNVKMNNMTQPDLLQYMAYARMSMDDEQLTFSTHYINGNYYIDLMGEKVSYPMPAMGEAIKKAMASSYALDKSADFFKDLSLRTQGDNRILTYTMDNTKLNDYMNQIFASMGMGSLLSGMSFNIRSMSGEYVVNPQGYFTKAKVKMTMDLTMDGETVTMNIDGDIGVADPGQPVSIDLPNPAEYRSIRSLM